LPESVVIVLPPAPQPKKTTRRMALLVPGAFGLGLEWMGLSPDTVAGVGEWAVRLSLVLALSGVIWSAWAFRHEPRLSRRMARMSFPVLLSGLLVVMNWYLAQLRNKALALSPQAQSELAIAVGAMGVMVLLLTVSGLAVSLSRRYQQQPTELDRLIRIQRIRLEAAQLRRTQSLLLPRTAAWSAETLRRLSDETEEVQTILAMRADVPRAWMLERARDIVRLQWRGQRLLRTVRDLTRRVEHIRETIRALESDLDSAQQAALSEVGHSIDEWLEELAAFSGEYQRFAQSAGEFFAVLQRAQGAPVQIGQERLAFWRFQDAVQHVGEAVGLPRLWGAIRRHVWIFSFMGLLVGGIVWGVSPVGAMPLEGVLSGLPFGATVLSSIQGSDGNAERAGAEHVADPAGTPSALSAGASRTMGVLREFPQPRRAAGADLDLDHLSLINGHRSQWQWLREQVLPDLVRRARARDARRLRILSLGAGTGEEIARAFHELLQGLMILGEDPAAWQTVIDGIELDPHIVEEGRRRLGAEAPFVWWAQHKQQRDEAFAYAQTVLKTMLDRFKDADLVLLNGVLVSLPSYDAREAVLRHLDAWRDAWIVLTSHGGLFWEVAEHHAIHTLKPEKPAFIEGRMYYFGKPFAMGGALIGLLGVALWPWLQPLLAQAGPWVLSAISGGLMAMIPMLGQVTPLTWAQRQLHAADFPDLWSAVTALYHRQRQQPFFTTRADEVFYLVFLPERPDQPVLYRTQVPQEILGRNDVPERFGHFAAFTVDDEAVR